MIIKKLIIVISLLLSASVAFSAEYYIATDGNDTTGDGSTGTPWLTLDRAFDSGEATYVAGGDTLWIKDGTYQGNDNAISSTLYPPAGSAPAYTTIKAVTDGAAIFDGENARRMFNYTQSSSLYWQFEGIIWARSSNSTVTLTNTSETYPNLTPAYVKFLRCGAYDTADGNTSNWFIRSSYVLLEGCYGYGSGRYKFLSFTSDHIIFRNCVGRPDNISATGEPAAVFSVYQNNYSLVQNCIAIDGDQDDEWVTSQRSGCFLVPTTSASATNTAFKKCVGLNTKLGGISVADNNSTENVTFEDIVIWDVDNPGSPELLLNIQGSSGATGDYVKNITAGESSVLGSWTPDWPSLTNSIFYNITLSSDFYDFGLPTINDYNCYFGNTNNTGRNGANDLTATDPTTNSLFYLPRIEIGSDLAGAGDSGEDIGANVDNLIGTSETLWGETGYDTNTGTSMWPFPNEDLIRSKMKVYTWDNGDGGDPEIVGDRGFCVDDETLTKYIWEYLGNTIPSDIYGTSETVAGADLAGAYFH